MKNNQLRKHLKWTLSVRFRNLINQYRLGSIGKQVFIEKGVELMRYPKNIFLENNLVIKSGARICPCNTDATIHIGENTTIGYNTYLFASNKISIGQNCLIAPFVYIVDSDHNISKHSLINEQGNSTAEIRIGNDVWIGTGAKILKGVTIKDGAVIASGAIVKNDIGAYEIHGGIPAKKISDRK